MSDMIFTVRGTGLSPVKMSVDTGDFKFTVDGSNMEAASPVTYLLGILAGCLNITGHMVAKEMGLALNRMDVEVEGLIDPSVFLGESAEGRAGYKRLSVKLTADMTADENQRKLWLEAVSGRCPVMDNLKNLTKLDVQLTL